MAALVGRLLKLGWSLLTWITLSALVAALVAGWYYLQRADEEIRSVVQARLAQHYPGLKVQVGSARLLQGEGIRLRQIWLEDPTGSEPEERNKIVELEEIFLRCNPSLSELLKGRLQVRQIHLRGLKLHAARETDGRWNLQKLWPLPQFTQPPDPLPEVVLEQAVIELRDRSAGTELAMVFREIGLQVRTKRLDGQTPQAVLMAFQGSLTTDYCRKIDLHGAARTADGAWSVKGNVHDLEWSPALLAALPSMVSGPLRALTPLHATSQLNFQLAQSATDAGPRFWVSGHVQDGRWQAEPGPSMLSNLQAEFQVDNQGLRVPQLTADLGSGRVSCSLRTAGHDLSGSYEVLLAADHVQVNSRLVAWLPDRFQQAWQKCQAVGEVSGNLDFRSDGSQLTSAADLTCHDLTVLHREFPYPVTNCRGSVRFQQQVLNFDLNGSAGGTPITIKGSVRQPGPLATGWWEIKSSRWKQIDDALIAALPASAQRFLRQLRPRGQVGFWARFERDAPVARPAVPHFIVAIHEGRINYDAFPYPIGSIQGKIECRDGRWRFQDLRGWNDRCLIECNGAWLANDELRPLTLNLRAHNVVLGDDLQRAVRPELQRLWSDLQLQGTLDDLDIQLQYSAVSPRPRLEIRASQASFSEAPQNTGGLQVRPVWFPYRLTDVGGKLRWADGGLSVQGLSARHGKTRMRANLTANLSQPNRWRLQLTDVALEGLRPDEDLLAAMPPRLAEGVQRVKLDGTLSVAGALHLTRPAADLPVTAGWDVLLNLEEAAFSAGLPIDHAFGQVRLRGQYDGEQFWSRGALQVDSLICRNLQLTQLQGPLWIDSQRLALGGRVPPESSVSGATPLVASVYGGQLSLDAEVGLDTDNRFDLRANLANADVNNIARDAQIGRGNLTGQAFLGIVLSGSARGPHTLRGQGSAQVRNGNLYELPLVLALLNRLSSGNRSNAAFTSGDVSFQVRGGHMYFDRFDLGGDAITLKGIGEMGLDRQLDLDFYSIVGREQLWSPIVRPILGEASRQFLRIHVDGTLDHPVTTQEVLPGLNETLQQLFPELASYKGRASEGNSGGILTGRRWWNRNR